MLAWEPVRFDAPDRLMIPLVQFSENQVAATGMKEKDSISFEDPLLDNLLEDRLSLAFFSP